MGLLQENTAEALDTAWPAAQRRQDARVPHAPMVVLAALVALFSLVPLGFIGWVTYDVGWETVKTLVFRPRVGELVLNTIYLELIAIPLSIVVAVATAFLTERSDIPFARLWAWLAVTPLAVPAFVHSYAWVSLIPSMHGLASSPILRSSPCPSPPRCAASIRRWRMPPPRSALRRPPCSSAWCCRNCAFPFAAARC